VEYLLKNDGEPEKFVIVFQRAFQRALSGLQFLHVRHQTL